MQLLEGPRDAVDALMDRISHDRRHTDVEVVLYDDIKVRRFSEGTLAYSGASVFVDGLIVAWPSGPHLGRIRET